MKGLLCHTREDPRRFRLHVMTNRKIQQKNKKKTKKKCVNGFFLLFLLEKLNPVSVPDALETVRPSNNRWSLPISNGKIEKEKKTKFNTRS